MKKIVVLIMLILPFLYINSQAQLIGNPFKAKDGLTTLNNQLKSDGITDAKLLVVGTMNEEINIGIGTFNIEYKLKEGTSTAWLYIVQSKAKNDSIFAYGIINFPLVGFFAQKLPAEGLISMLPFTPSVSLSDFSWMNSDAIGTRITNNEAYINFIAKYPKAVPLDAAVGVNEIPPFELNQPYWAVGIQDTLNSKNPTLNCFVQAITGAVDCSVKGPNAVEDDALNSMNISVSPNPASDYVYITVPKELQSPDSKLELYNIYGQKAANLYAPRMGEAQKAMLSLENFQPGVYFIRYSTGDKVFVEKLVIER